MWVVWQDRSTLAAPDTRGVNTYSRFFPINSSRCSGQIWGHSGHPERVPLGGAGQQERNSCCYGESMNPRHLAQIILSQIAKAWSCWEKSRGEDPLLTEECRRKNPLPLEESQPQNPILMPLEVCCLCWEGPGNSLSHQDSRETTLSSSTSPNCHQQHTTIRTASNITPRYVSKRNESLHPHKTYTQMFIAALFINLLKQPSNS